MTEEAKKTLAALEKLDWFWNVGQAIGADAAQVHSWKEALRICRSRDSDNVQLESQNLLTEKLCFQFPDKYHGKWNPLVTRVKKKTDPLVLRKVLASACCPKLPEPVLAMIRSDVRLIIMELEYADIVPPRFFAQRAKWYLAGHFPCGWEGDFPQGRLIVY